MPQLPWDGHDLHTPKTKQKLSNGMAINIRGSNPGRQQSAYQPTSKHICLRARLLTNCPTYFRTTPSHRRYCSQSGGSPSHIAGSLAQRQCGTVARCSKGTRPPPRVPGTLEVGCTQRSNSGDNTIPVVSGGNQRGTRQHADCRRRIQTTRVQMHELPKYASTLYHPQTKTKT